MTRIVFDSQIFSLQQFGGISRYVCALAEQLVEHDGVDAQICAPLHINQYLRALKTSGNVAVRGLYIPSIPRLGQSLSVLNQALFPICAMGQRTDVIHETYFSGTPLYRARAARVLTVYDLIHERFPQSFLPNDPVAHNRAQAIRRADHLICISESTRRDLLETYQVPESKVSVTYLGYDTLPLSSLSASSLVGVRPYLLYVGSRHGYKNFDGLLEAYARSQARREGVRIVCFGGGPLTATERSLIQRYQLHRNDVAHVSGTDERLAALYAGAVAFVYPSKYEGFGIPPLEAMSLGCPVICSHTSSIPEVVGQAGAYFDPNLVESMQQTIDQVLLSPTRQKELSTLGNAQVSLFSWKRCAAQTLAVYRELEA